jgi:hypothetical protein
METINFEVYPKIEEIPKFLAEEGLDAVLLEGNVHLIY